MFRLMKYEFRKTRLSKLILLALMAVLEIVYLYALYSKKDDTLAFSILCLTLLSILGIVAVGVQSILTLHRDMNTRQGYMLFMTPHSCYTILGAKVLECFFSILLFGIFCAALGLLDVRLLVQEYGSVEDFLDFTNTILQAVNKEIQLTPQNLLALAAMETGSWLCAIMTAVLADILASSLLRGQKYSGLISFVFFIGMSLLLSKLSGLIPRPAALLDSMLVSAGVSTVLAALMYVPSAILMEQKLSV